MENALALPLDAGNYRLLAVEASGVVAAIVGVAVHYYEQRRPGAQVFALANAPFLGIALVAAIFQAPNSTYGYVFALLRP